MFLGKRFQAHTHTFGLLVSGGGVVELVLSPQGNLLGINVI